MYNLYLLTQNEEIGYDTYDSCIVVAYDEESARRMHPHYQSNEYSIGEDSIGELEFKADYGVYTWARKLSSVNVTLIGTAHSSLAPGVVLASFNAG